MKVKDLIEQLQQQDPNDEALITGDLEQSANPIDHVDFVEQLNAVVIFHVRD